MVYNLAMINYSVYSCACVCVHACMRACTCVCLKAVAGSKLQHACSHKRVI